MANSKRKKPQCANRYCNRFKLLQAFSARSSTAPEAARRIGMAIQEAEGAASSLKKLKYVDHIPDEGYYITELGHQALANTPEIYAPVKLSVRYGRARLIRRLQDVRAGPELRARINDIIRRLGSKSTPVYKQARIDALTVLFDKKNVTMSSADVEEALRAWLKKRYKIESDLEIRFTGKNESPIEITAVCTEK